MCEHNLPHLPSFKSSMSSRPSLAGPKAKSPKPFNVQWSMAGCRSSRWEPPKPQSRTSGLCSSLKPGWLDDDQYPETTPVNPKKGRCLASKIWVIIYENDGFGGPRVPKTSNNTEIQPTTEGRIVSCWSCWFVCWLMMVVSNNLKRTTAE